MACRYHLAVISARRPHSVRRMAAWGCNDATWYVPAVDQPAYQAQADVELAFVDVGRLSNSRNTALDNAFALGLPCVQVADDLKQLYRIDAQKNKYPATIDEIAQHLLVEMNRTHTYFGGIPPTANPFFARGRGFKSYAWIIAEYMVIRPNPLRFDESIELKEDYDYTAAQLERYSAVCRTEEYLGDWGHYTNPGGVTDYRTLEMEKETAAYIMGKWPGRFRLNSRRPGEMLLVPPRATRRAVQTT